MNVARIQSATASSFGVDAYTMTERSNRGEGDNGRNKWAISRPRQVAMYLSWILLRPKYSKSRIGKLFGERDHTTVIHAIAAVEQRMKQDEALRQRVHDIRVALLSEKEPAPFVFVPKPAPRPVAERRPTNDWRAIEAAEERRWKEAHHEIMHSIPYEPKVREEDRVCRDPCRMCGVRSDIGCVHTRAAA